MKRSELIDEFDKYKGNVEYSDGKLECTIEREGIWFKVQFIPTMCKKSLVIQTMGLPSDNRFKHRQDFQRVFRFEKYDAIDEPLLAFSGDILTTINDVKNRNKPRDSWEIDIFNPVLGDKYCKPSGNKVLRSSNFSMNDPIPLSEEFTKHNGKPAITVDELWDDIIDEDIPKLNKKVRAEYVRRKKRKKKKK